MRLCAQRSKHAARTSLRPWATRSAQPSRRLPMQSPRLLMHNARSRRQISRRSRALRARMALHTGQSAERDGDYFGPTVNRVARLLATGHGGQVLVSGTCAELVQGELPPQCSLRDLGAHRLKDLAQPERVYQLIAPDLSADFPRAAFARPSVKQFAGPAYLLRRPRRWRWPRSPRSCSNTGS